MKDFRQLKVWQKAHPLALETYRLIPALPAEERFVLADQMRRAAVSVPSNIAEGCGRDSDKELARFLRIAAGSASELEYQVLLALDLGYLSPEQHTGLDQQTNEVKRMLNSLTRRREQTANG